MRLALAHSHLETFGGGERAVLEVGRRLRARHDVLLLAGRYRPDDTYAELGAFPRATLGSADWLLGRMPPVDAVIANSFGANLLSLRRGRRTIYWVHSLRSVFLVARIPRPDLVARRLLDLVAVRRSARLVANSDFTARGMLRLYGRPADAVVRPGVDVERFRPAAEPPQAHALTVGRLAPEKGLDRLFSVFAGLPDIPRLGAGAGHPTEEHRLRALAPPNVHFLGRLDADDLVRAYQRAAVAVFAPYDEELGLAPVEAMACGTPVVAWRSGGLAESVVHDESGLLVDDGATFRRSVRSVLDDAGLRARLAANGRARALDRTWESAALALERLCLAVAGWAA